MLTRFTAHPRKPRTLDEVGEFKALVRADTLTMSEIGKRYGTCQRTVHRWAAEFGVGDVRRHRAAFRGPFRAAARDIAHSTVRAVEEIGKAAGLAATRTAGAPEEDGDIACALAQIGQMSLETETAVDLARLQVAVVRLLCLLLAKAPHTHLSLFGSAQELCRLTIYARRIEAELPPSHDPAALRNAAARQMLRELGGALNIEEQEVMDNLIRLAADRIKAGAIGGATGATPSLIGVHAEPGRTVTPVGEIDRVPAPPQAPSASAEDPWDVVVSADPEKSPR